MDLLKLIITLVVVFVMMGCSPDKDLNVKSEVSDYESRGQAGDREKEAGFTEEDSIILNKATKGQLGDLTVVQAVFRSEQGWKLWEGKTRGHIVLKSVVPRALDLQGFVDFCYNLGGTAVQTGELLPEDDLRHIGAAHALFVELNEKERKFMVFVLHPNRSTVYSALLDLD